MNAQRQLALGSVPKPILVIRPPSTEEIRPPVASAAVQTVIARARALAVCVPAATMARLVGNSAAAPIPAMICPIHSTSTRVSVDDPAPGVRMATPSPMASANAPPTNSRLRPNRSPSTPKVSSSRATGTMKAAEIQVSCDEVGPRSCWNKPLRTVGTANAT